MNVSKRLFHRPARRVVFLIVLLAIGALAGWQGAVQAQSARGTDRQQFLEGLQILGSVYERVYYNYVDDVDADKLLEAGIQGMMEYLDEHSQYLPPVNYEDLMMSTEGEFGGLGITINIRDHYPTVISPMEGTPAFLMGVQGGDQIVEIEGEDTLDFTSNDAVKLLRGEPGTDVTITLRREGRAEDFPLTITRDIIKVESVPYAFMMDDIGYIRIQNFSRTTVDEMVAKLAELEAAGARGLILDLRWNPGGLLEAACGVSELFLDADDLIVYTKGRLRNQNRSYYAENTGHGHHTDLPLIVMINGSSASASEIVSAAIQDHDEGLVVGKTSSGKGSVQTVFPLSDDRALKLTTAKYYTPSGRSIHKDRAREEGLDLTLDPDAETDPHAEADVAREDREQFATAAGRMVYGGGGITPDIEIDQTLRTDFEVAVERDYALFSFAAKWAADHEVPRDLVVTQEMFDAFVKHLGTRENIDEYLAVFDLKRTPALIAENEEYLRRGIRRELMRLAYGAQAAFQVAIEEDEQLHEVCALFKRARSTADLLAIAAEWEADRVAQAAAQEAPTAVVR